jgi:hypothetical protein
MELLQTLAPDQVATLSLAVVHDVLSDHSILVEQEGVAASVARAEVLNVSGEPLLLAPGDRVLIWRDSGGSRLAVVIGRLGPSQAASCPGSLREDATERQSGAEIQEELVLEARRALTLRVGQGSITIRDDGKILIKGKDLVSHAQRMNRIKGGAVSIN